MTERDVTVDGDNPNKTTMAALDRYLIIDSEVNPNELKEITHEKLLEALLAVVGGGIVSGPQGYGDNYVITPSIASGNLSVALKTIAGTDPSSSNKLRFRIGNAERELSAALSVTVNAGANTFNAGATEFAAKKMQLFVYVGYRAASSTVFVLLSRIPHGRTYADFSGTATNEKYGAYSGSAPASTDEVECIGRIGVQNSGTASYDWSIPADAYVVNRPIYETDWLEWLPTRTGYSANPTNDSYRYKLIRSIVHLAISEGTAGTSNATTKTYTAPFTAANITNMNWGTSSTLNVDNNTLQPSGVAYISTNSNIINATKSAFANWTGSGSCRALAMAEIFFEI